MTTPFPAGESQALTRAVALLLLLGAGVLAVLAQALAAFAAFSAWFIGATLACYAGAALLIAMHVGRHHPHANFGAANVVTLLRLLLTCLSAGLVAQSVAGSAVLSRETAWLFTSIAVIALLLDGLDGLLARRSGQMSRFGARFDMEVDALQILLLSITAAALDKAGGWVVLAGLMRYAFVVSGWLWPQLAQPLPPSMRRKFVCAVQIAALIALLAPPVQPPASVALALMALVLLVGSFALDVIWALRQPPLQPAT